MLQYYYNHFTLKYPIRLGLAMKINYHNENNRFWHHELENDFAEYLINAAQQLQRRHALQNSLSKHEIKQSIGWLLMLLEYFSGNPQIAERHTDLMMFIYSILGLNKAKAPEERETLQQKEADRIEREFEDLKARLAMYEFYKIVNPNRIAGETERENFINNVHVRGLTQALILEGTKSPQFFNVKEMELTSTPSSFVDRIMAEEHNKRSIGS